MHYIIQTYRRSTDYLGRSNRKEYWFFALYLFFVKYGLFYLSQIVSQNLGSGEIGIKIITVYLAYPALPLTIRRYQDCNLSRWWAFAPVITLLAAGLPLVYLIATIPNLNRATELETLSILGCVAIMTITFIVHIVITSMPGTNGLNNYGEKPE